MFINEANGISSTQFDHVSDETIKLKSNGDFTIVKNPNGDFDVLHHNNIVDSDLSLEDAVDTVDGVASATPQKNVPADIQGCIFAAVI